LITGIACGVGVVAGGADVPVTMTCAVATDEPMAFVAVSVYIAVEAGVTNLVPVNATLPIPGWISTEVAPVTDQLRVDVPPAEMDMGLASNTFIAGALRMLAGMVQLTARKGSDIKAINNAI